MVISKAIRIAYFLSSVLLIFSCNQGTSDSKEIRKGNLTREAWLQIDTAKSYLQQVVRYDSLDRRIETTWYERNGKIATISRPVYDSLGRMIRDDKKITERDGTRQFETYIQTYDGSGLVSASTFISTMNNGDSLITQYIYDSNKRLVKEISRNSSGAFWKGTTVYLYQKDKPVKIQTYNEDNTINSYDSIIYTGTGKSVYSFNWFRGRQYEKEVVIENKGKVQKELYYRGTPEDSLGFVSETTYTYNKEDSLETKSKTHFASTEWCGERIPEKTMTFKYVYIWK